MMGLKDILEIFILGFFAAVAVFALMLTFAYLFPSENINTHQLDCVGADGHYINLTENPNATDVTYEQVIDFVANDTTDQMLYNSSFQCADYAEMLHNHAEAAGIQCGFVAITLGHGFGHACNAFDTTDRGRIYIDCTESDKRVDVVVGHDYTPVSLRHGNPDYEPLDTVLGYNTVW